MKISRQRRGRASGHPITGLMDRIPDSLSHSLSIYRPLSFISSFLSRLSCSFLSFFRSVALRSFRCDCRVFFFRLFFSSFSSFTYFLHPSWCLLFLSFLLPFFLCSRTDPFPFSTRFLKKKFLIFDYGNPFSCFTYFLDPSWCLLFLSFLRSFYFLEPIRFPSVLDFWKKIPYFRLWKPIFLFYLLPWPFLMSSFSFFLTLFLFSRTDPFPFITQLKKKQFRVIFDDSTHFLVLLTSFTLLYVFFFFLSYFL